MQFEEFDIYMVRLYACFGKMANNKQSAEFFDVFQDVPEPVFAKAFDMLRRGEKFPTINTMSQVINLFKAKESLSLWNGAPCSREDCDHGLIFYHKKIKDNWYSFVARCPQCKSYDAPTLPFYDYSMEDHKPLERNYHDAQ